MQLTNQLIYNRAQTQFKLKLLKEMQVDNDDGSKITTFLQKNHIYDDLAQQLEDMLQTNKPKELQTFFQSIQDLNFQIVKDRPKKVSLKERILNDLAGNIGKTMLVCNVQRSSRIRGKIKQIRKSQTQDSLKIKLCIVKEEKDVELKFSKHFISEVQFQEFTEISLEEQLRFILTNKQQNRKTYKLIYNKNAVNNSILPMGVYYIESSYKNETQIHQFKNIQTSQMWKLQVRNQNNDKIVTFFDGKQSKKNLYIDFIDNYHLFRKEKLRFYYTGQDQNQKSIMLINSDQVNEQQKLDKIEKLINLKQLVINKLINENKEIYKEYLDKLINEQNIKMEIKDKTLQPQVNAILQLSKQLYGLDRTQVIRQLFTSANYKNFCNISECLITAEIIERLAVSSSKLQDLLGKEAVFFYGITSSGKSTSINFLIGLPLKETVNKYGDNVIQIDQNKFDRVKRKQQIRCAKIGTSICISQTYQSEGFPILQQTIQNNQKKPRNRVLVDNPGFKENRGQAYEICANYSMEKAIKQCEKIKAIVLVVAYETITNERANGLVEVMQELNEKYPELLSQNSQIFKRFYILVTKSPSSITKAILKERFAGLKAQTMRLRQQRSKMLSLQRRQKIFSILNSMIQDPHKIRLLKLKIRKVRDQILEQYFQSQSYISKQQYKPMMRNRFLKKKFIDQISLSAFTWINLLKKYFQDYPLDLKDLQEKIESEKSQLEINKKRIDNLKLTISQNQKLNQIQILQNNLSQLNSMVTQIQESSPEEIVKKFQLLIRLQLIAQVDNMPRYTELKEVIARLIKGVGQDLQSKFDNHNQLTAKNLSLVDYLKRVGQQLKEIHERIQFMQNDDRFVELTKIGYKLNQVIQSKDGCQILAKDQNKKGPILKMLGNIFNKNKQLKSVVVGCDEFGLLSTIKLSRESDYKITQFPAQLDPSNAIENAFNSAQRLSVSDASLIIKAGRTVLEELQIKKRGKQVQLQILQKFSRTNNPQQLPFIQFTQKIPGNLWHKNLIEQCRYELREKFNQVQNIAAEILQNQVAKLQNAIKLLQLNQQFLKLILVLDMLQKANIKYKQIKGFQKYQLQKKQDIEEAKSKIIEKLNAMLIVSQNQIATLSQKFNSDRQKLRQQEDDRLRIKQQIISLENQHESVRKSHVRLAYLIRDQIRKRVPQLLYKFIDETLRNEKAEDLSQNKRNLVGFNEKYGEVRERLQEILQNHLRKSKFKTNLQIDQINQ